MLVILENREILNIKSKMWSFGLDTRNMPISYWKSFIYSLIYITKIKNGRFSKVGLFSVNENIISSACKTILEVLFFLYLFSSKYVVLLTIKHVLNVEYTA